MIAQLRTRWTSLPTGLKWMVYAALAVFVLSLVQALGKGSTDSLTSDTSAQAALRWCVPILLAGLGGVFSERAGVINIGLEGMMVLGTWFGALGAFHFGPWGGLLVGLFGGAAGGLIHAVATVSFGVDHIISGVAINILAEGGVRYLSDQVFNNPDRYPGGALTQSPRVEDAVDFTMPFLAGGWGTPDWLGSIDRQEWFFISDLAGLTRGLVAEMSTFTLLALALVPISGWVLWRTRFGLRLRIAGEEPLAGESLGVDIIRRKYWGVMISGALAGMGGAFIVSEMTGIYREGQVNNRGFIGLAATIFGNYRPSGVLAGALLFAFPRGLSLRDLDGTATHALLAVVTIAMALLFVVSLRRGKRVDAGVAAVLGVASAVWYFTTETVPTWFPNILPFVMVLLVLLFNSSRLRMPASDGVIYRRGET